MATKLYVEVPAVALTFDKKVLKQTLRTAGNEVAAATRRLISSSVGGGKVYYGSGGSSAAYRGGYRAGKYTASAPGMAPAKVTGTLARSVKVRPFKNGEGVAVRDNAFYALFLEAGAKGGGGSRRGGNLLPAGTLTKRGMLRGHNRLKAGAITKGGLLAPRPFLSRALEMQEQNLEKRIGEAALKGIKMERLGGAKAGGKGVGNAVQRAMAAGKK